MNFIFCATPAFQKNLAALDTSERERIKEKLILLQKAENPLLLAKKLKGYKDLFRFRVGDYRVVFHLKKNQIILLMAAHRKSIYEGL